jgi:ornithine cyclodeaminase
MLILRHREVALLLMEQEIEIVEVIADTYLRHAEGRTSVPHSLFLRFADEPSNRIIALPAYLDGEKRLAGIKWVSSFPANIKHDSPRASAVVVLNDTTTGYPDAILEGASISAGRTAASAALAARELTMPDLSSVAIVGCGPIARQVLRYLRAVRPAIGEVTLYDIDVCRAKRFADSCAEEVSGLDVAVSGTLDGALAVAGLVVFTTTAMEPYTDVTACAPETVVLHLSLRDITPAAVLESVNIVDDADHVCRAGTSLHLAEQRTGGRDFIHGSLGEILRGAAVPSGSRGRPTIFTPFGLGVLDLALADFVRERARAEGVGLEMADFLP